MSVISLYPVASLAAVTPVSSIGSQGLVLSEVYVGSPTNASDEYVVVHNNSAQPIQLKGLEIEYKSATGKSWVRKAHLDTSLSLAGYASYTIASKLAHDLILQDGLAQTAGNLRLSVTGEVLDQLAWGAADSPEKAPVPAPKAGEALERVCDTDGHICLDTDDNLQDFDPVGIDVAANPTVPGKGDNTGGGTTSVTTAGEDFQIEITELLPDPASPQTDAKDEFVELYNAGSAPARLIGWTLTDGKHTSKLDAITVPAGGYSAVYSRDSKLSLNNSGDVMRLINSSGVTVFTAPDYGKAKSGVAFGATSVGWGWLERPTPGGTNAALAADQSETASNSKKTTNGTVKKASTGTKKAGAASKSGKLASAKAASTQTTEAGLPADKPTTPWGWILAGLGVFTVGYGAYEYRPEILSFFTKLRAKLGARK